MPAHFTILGSGSSGNCAYLETDDVRLLIDAGLSGRQIRQRLLTIGRAPENLDGILLTHEHTDHVQGLVGLAKLNLPIYCNRATHEALLSQHSGRLTSPPNPNVRLFHTGSSFDIGSVHVDTFSVPHDAQDPVGFLLHTSHGKFGVLTDLGHATKLAVDRVKSANVLLLEANYDLRLLQDDTRRPWATKQRIMSRHGHLSNDAAADVAEAILSDNLTHLFLGHLSSDCNTPQLALDTLARRLDRLGASTLHLHTASQSAPCPTLTIGA